MLTIKTWCLPGGLSEEDLNNLHNAMVAAVISVREAGVKDESMMLNLFPTDMMSYGLGNEISIEITQVPSSCTPLKRAELAAAVGLAVRKFFPKANIGCEALPVNNTATYWSAISKEKQFTEECKEELHK